MVLCWGTGDTGQLGLGENTLCRKKPAVVKGTFYDYNINHKKGKRCVDCGPVSLLDGIATSISYNII